VMFGASVGSPRIVALSTMCDVRRSSSGPRSPAPYELPSPRLERPSGAVLPDVAAAPPVCCSQANYHRHEEGPTSRSAGPQATGNGGLPWYVILLDVAAAALG
jgi:hypothetical protein